MMNAFVIVISVLFLAVSVLVNRHYLHVFQLSSYQTDGFFRTLLKEKECLLLPVTAVCMYMMVTGRGPSVILFAATAALMALTLYLYRPKKAKKAFVVTDRVKRLITTITVLTLLCGAVPLVMWHIASSRSVSEKLFSIYYACLPVMAVFAGGINSQDEKRINERFISEASGMLRRMPELRVIGITGSFGKTSMKYALATILEERFRVLKTPESWNTPMGITRCIREQLKPTHEIFVCEMGARHLEDIEEITKFVHPDDGILTAVGEQHLETFKSMDNILKAKTDLLRAVGEKHHPLARKQAEGEGKASPKGVKLINGDSALLMDYCAKDYAFADVVTYGFNGSNDYRIKDVSTTLSGTTFTLVTPGGEEIKANSLLVGEHNVLNLAGAAAMAFMCGMSAEEIAKGIKRVKSVPHRLELKRNGNVTILDDAYNANPEGARAALKTLSMFDAPLKILVTPGMIELGEKQDELNRELGAEAAKVSDVIITVNEVNAKAISEGVLSAGFDKANLHACRTFDEANELMMKLMPGTERVILLLNDLPDNYK